MSLAQLAGVSALVLTFGALILWRRSLAVRDASIVDTWWGPAFVLVATIGVVAGEGAPARRVLLFSLVSIWGVRLGLHIHRRNRGKGEDPRYAAMRKRHGDAFGRVSLWSVFLLQAGIALIVAAPLLAAASVARPAELGAFDFAGTAVWLVGFLFEAVGDAQLRRFRSEPSNRNRVMDRGLWRYTRHPNYFGDAVVWWGLWLVAAAAPAARWSVIGPLLMTFLLLKVSGAALLEKGLKSTKPAYAEYVRRTSGFVPWFPRR